MAHAVAALLARQYQSCAVTEDGFIDENSCDVPFWGSKTGVIVKWSLFLGLVVFVALYIFLGHLHAQRRIQNGLPPLRYHRFLVSRSTIARTSPQNRYPQPASARPYNPDNQYYDMNSMPPPVYDPNAPRPPMYEPPAGSTKVGSQQHGAEQSQQAAGEPVEYTPPAGPPPSSGQAQDTPAPPAPPAPPSGPPPSYVQTQTTGNANPFRD
ncbi:hypothetical protein BT67DRAFT_450941 [Trichocladium antarcticum]|uniref:Uncharacterized protein n=1 Tax=Trichocladium antarcticum TaxID=1450529 RepID=A0AAN6ZB36_9PEZI|nr:hypothetical protein BT67DRAFT_450941 [Trichocladium antarcticum]